MSESSDDDRIRLIELRERLIEGDIAWLQSLTLDLFKWAMAATLTLNGGPLLALLGSESLRPLLSQVGPYFAVGVGLSVFGNLWLIKGLAKSGQALFYAHWNGESTKLDNYADVASGSDSNRWSLMASLFLGLSIVAFIAGVIALGNNLNAEPTKPKTQIESIKK